MCGIHGFLGEDPNRLFRMTASATHRGPDGLGVYRDRRVSLGQNLLSIMDVPDVSGQPWRAKSGRHFLCFNGAIYNHIALRYELEARGARFRTQCDTEVLAEGLSLDGPAFLNRLDGMYAIAFYDEASGTLLLARDAAGMKPLYYSDSDGLAFSSELRAVSTLARKLDLLAATFYFELGYVPGPRTLIEGVSKLTPGEWRLYKVDGGALIRCGAVGRVLPERQDFSPGLFRAAANSAVRGCLLGLRSTGLYLSGGFDSSIILHEAVSLGAELETFSTRFIGPEDEVAPFNEDAALARRLANEFGLRHHEIDIDPARFVDVIEAAAETLEEPRYNRSTPAYFIAAQAQAEAGSTVTLAGDGGDELLGGYPKYADFLMLQEAGAFAAQSLEMREAIFAEQSRLGRWRWAPPADLHLNDPVHRWYFMSKFRLEERGLVQGVRAPASNEALMADLRSWIGPESDGGDDMLNTHLALDQLTWLPEDALIRNDKLGMAFGMEGRFPLLTREFRDYAMALPPEVKILSGKLKRAPQWAYEGVLPDFITDRRRKSGWSAPVLVWEGGRNAFADLMGDTLAMAAQGPLAEAIDFAGISASGEPKLMHAGLYLAIWARRMGVSL